MTFVFVIFAHLYAISYLATSTSTSTSISISILISICEHTNKLIHPCIRTAACVSFLISQGACPFLSDSEGLTAAAHALAFDHIDVIRILPVHMFDSKNLNWNLYANENENENGNENENENKNENKNENFRSAYHIVCQWNSIRSLKYLLELKSFMVIENIKLRRDSDEIGDDENYNNNNNDNNNHNNKNHNHRNDGNNSTNNDNDNNNNDNCSNNNNNSLNISMLDGTRPIHLAARYGHLDCLKILVSHNADIEVLDNYNNTPYLLAKKWGRQNCEDYLFETLKETIREIEEE